jgi:hypothetical protein
VQVAAEIEARKSAQFSFWIGPGKVEERADQALARAKEAHGRWVMSAFADYRAAMAADIAIVKTLAETNTAALASAENRLAAAIEQMNARFGELNQRIDRLLDGREGWIAQNIAVGLDLTVGGFHGQLRPQFVHER